MNKVSKNFERREITAPVLVPEEVDYHGHIYNDEEVYKACRNYQEKCGKSSLQHRFELSKDDADFVEHYIAPADMTFTDEVGEILVKKGTWLATMKVKNDTLWERVKEGSFTGFSIQAMCKSLKLEKAKVAGRAASEEGVKATKRLFDIDFSDEDHHVALVDEAANATKVLVVKAKHSPDNPVNPESPADPASVNINKDDNLMTIEELQKEKELLETKVQEMDALSKQKADLEVELEDLRKAKEAQASVEAELETLRKEKDAREVSELISKSKEYKADEPESFALILQKCKKSLNEGEYEVLSKQLQKLSNIEKSEKFLKDVGEGSTTEEVIAKSKDAKFYEKRQAYIEEGMTPADASKKARIELEQSK